MCSICSVGQKATLSLNVVIDLEALDNEAAEANFNISSTQSQIF